MIGAALRFARDQCADEAKRPTDLTALLQSVVAPTCGMPGWPFACRPQNRSSTNTNRRRSRAQCAICSTTPSSTGNRQPSRSADYPRQSISTSMGNDSREIIVAPIARPTGDSRAMVRSEVGTAPRRGPSSIRIIGDNTNFTVGGQCTCPGNSAALGASPLETPSLGAGFRTRSRLLAIKRGRLKPLALFKRWEGLRHAFLRANLAAASKCDCNLPD